MSDNNLKKWALEYGIEEIDFLGSGDFGEAYSIDEDRVLKVTSDRSEIVLAYALLNKNFHNLSNILGVRIFDDGTMGILQEQLNTDGVEDLFNEVHSLCEASSIGISELDQLEPMMIEYNLSSRAQKMVADLSKSIREINLSSGEGCLCLDINPGNIGLNKNNNYCLFDQRVYREVSDEEIDILKAKLKIEYKKLEENPYSITINPEHLIASSERVSSAFQDIKDGNYSKKSIKCEINHNGDIQVVSGHKKLLEKLMVSEEEVSVEIIADNRHKDNEHKISDPLEIDDGYTYMGLEEVIDEDEINQHYDKIDKHNSLSGKKFYHGTSTSLWNPKSNDGYLFITSDQHHAAIHAISKAEDDNAKAVIVELDYIDIENYELDPDNDINEMNGYKNWKDSYEEIGSLVLIGDTSKLNFSGAVILDTKKYKDVSLTEMYNLPDFKFKKLQNENKSENNAELA